MNRKQSDDLTPAQSHLFIVIMIILLLIGHNF
jgi:hypothetical protein